MVSFQEEASIWVPQKFIVEFIMLNISSNDAEKRMYSQVITFANDEKLFSLVEGQTLQIQMANYL